MSRRRLGQVRLWMRVGIGLLCFFVTHSSYAYANVSDSPLSVIQTLTERVVTILQDTSLRGPAQSHQRMEKIRQIALPYFDSREIARRTLGIHWRGRTEAQREEFIHLFISLVETTYSGVLDRYRDDTQFLFDREHIEDRFAEVDSRIIIPTLNKPFSLNYRLHQVEGRWLIYDVVIENVSMVRNYRTQFNRIINKSSYEGLVQSIQSKLKQLSASSS